MEHAYKQGVLTSAAIGRTDDDLIMNGARVGPDDVSHLNIFP